jgi:hypothetical protein
MDPTQLEGFKDLERRFIQSVPVEERLAGLAPEERLAGLAPEERLAGLAPEETILALPDAMLARLPDAFLATLPDTVQRAVRAPPPLTGRAEANEAPAASAPCGTSSPAARRRDDDRRGRSDEACRARPPAWTHSTRWWCDACVMAPRRIVRAGRIGALPVVVWVVGVLSGCHEVVRGHDATTEERPVDVPKSGIDSVLVDAPECGIAGCQEVVRGYDATTEEPPLDVPESGIDSAPIDVPECMIGSLLVDVPEITRPRGDASSPPEIPWCDLMYLDMPCSDSRFAHLPHCGSGPWYCLASPSTLQVCQGGCCGLRCLQPGADCDADPATACDVDIWTDPRHCGGCGRTCAAGESCLAGRCLTTSARLLGPISALRTLVRRPWFRWELPVGANGARLELCATRGCERVEHTWDVAGASFRPPVPLTLGVHFWRVTPRRDGALDAIPSIPWEIWIGPAPEGALSSAAMADVNGDGEEDPVEELLPRRPLPDPGLVGRAGYIASYSPPIALGDLNGDGFGDAGFLQTLIDLRHMERPRPTELLVFRGGSAGATRAAIQIAIGDVCTPGELAVFPVGDRDGDGYGDAVWRGPQRCTSFYGLLPIYGGATRLGAGAFAESTSLLGWIGHGDFDADGLEDLVATCGTSALCAPFVRVRPGARDRSLHTREITVMCPTPDLARLEWFTNATVDHNDDGYDDLRSPSPPFESGRIIPGSALGLDGTRCAPIP